MSIFHGLLVALWLFTLAAYLWAAWERRQWRRTLDRRLLDIETYRARLRSERHQETDRC